MTGKEALESIAKIYDINKTTEQYKTIKKELERLERFEKDWDTISREHDLIFNRLIKENRQLVKAITIHLKALENLGYNISSLNTSDICNEIVNLINQLNKEVTHDEQS